MSRIEAAERITIERPLPLVRNHFGDVAHHQDTAVHPDVRFELIDDDGTTCVYRQTTRTGPLRLRQELQLDRSDPTSLLNTVTSGAFTGGTLRFSFAPAGPGTAACEVTAEFSGPTSGLTALVAPLLRRKLAASLRKALREDKVDLESDRYPGVATGREDPS